MRSLHRQLEATYEASPGPTAALIDDLKSTTEKFVRATVEQRFLIRPAPPRPEKPDWWVFRQGDRPPYQYSYQEASEKNATRKDALDRLRQAIRPGHNGVITRWRGVRVEAPSSLSDAKRFRDADGSTWTLYPDPESPGTNIVEYLFSAPAAEFPNHVTPKTPPTQLTDDHGTTWTLHVDPRVNRMYTVEAIYLVRH